MSRTVAGMPLRLSLLLLQLPLLALSRSEVDYTEHVHQSRWLIQESSWIG